MIFNQQPKRLVPLSDEVRERARSLWQLGIPRTPPTLSTFKPLSSKVKSARNSVLQRRKSEEDKKRINNQSDAKDDAAGKFAEAGANTTSLSNQRPSTHNLCRSKSLQEHRWHFAPSLRPRASFATNPRAARSEKPQCAQKAHNPADLCYVLLCMGALLHAEPTPRASLQLFACDHNRAQMVLFFAYLLGAPPGLPTRWLFPYVQKRVFSYLVGYPPHYIGLWNVGRWLNEKGEEFGEEWD